MQRGGYIPDVIALVAVARKLDFLAAEFEVTQPGRGTENVHLPAGVVDVVLALHVVTDEGEQVCQGGALGGAAAVTDVQRPGGIGGDEFHLNADTLADVAAAEIIALLENPGNDRAAAAAADEEIDETGPRDFDAFDRVAGAERLDDEFGQRARRHPGRLGHRQRDIGRKIALARLFRRGYL